MITNKTNNQLEKLANFYNAVYPPEESIHKAVNLIEKLLKKKKEKNVPVKILEPYTRTGKYAIELAKKGFKVKGLDPSKKMIENAKKNAENEKIIGKIEFENTNLEEETKKKEQYDLIIFLNNTISFITSPKELKMLLINSKKLLKEDGKILIHTVNYKTRKKKSRYYPLREIVIEEQNYIVQRFLDFEPKLVYNINIIGKKEEKWKYIHKFSFPLTNYSLKSLQNHVGTTGLKIEKIFGSYNEEKFEEDKSKNLILILNKKHS